MLCFCASVKEQAICLGVENLMYYIYKLDMDYIDCKMCLVFFSLDMDYIYKLETRPTYRHLVKLTHTVVVLGFVTLSIDK